MLPVFPLVIGTANWIIQMSALETTAIVVAGTVFPSKFYSKQNKEAKDHK